MQSPERTLEAVEEELRVARQHHGFDMVELQATQRLLLAEIRRLADDAYDALDIDTPAPHIAKSRLRRIIGLVAKA